ncbi:hypothetical protein BDQ12DRAFT_566229, partial [Crucibulum laeve]
WTARQLKVHKPETAIGIFNIWIHKKWSKEVSDKTVKELNKLTDKEVIEALNELRQPKKYIWEMNGQQMDLELIAQSIDDKQKFKINALLDSDCTGSCIDTCDATFAKENGINTYKYPRPIPVYNA